MKKFGVVCCLLFVSCYIRPIDIDCEAMFPNTPYKVVFDLCMKILGDLEALRDGAVEPHFRVVVVDAVIGGIYRLRYAIRHMIKVKKSVLLEDLEYLVVIMSNIVREYKGVMAHLVNDGNAGSVLTALRDQFESFLLPGEEGD